MRKIYFTLILIVGSINSAFTTDNVIVLNTAVPEKDVLIVAKEQIVLKPGFNAASINGNFYAKIGSTNSVSEAVVVSEGIGNVVALSVDEKTTTATSLEKTYVPLIPVTNSNSLNVTNSNIVMVYKDGFNRENMYVVKNATPKGNDLAQVVNYDVFNEVEKAWLPTPMDGIVTNDPLIVAQQSVNFHNDNKPYTKINQNGLLTSYCKPGTEYHSNTIVAQRNLTDYGQVSIIQFDVANNGYLIKADEQSTQNIFASRCVIDTDEDAKITSHYFDDYGNKILLRKYNDDGSSADTYYVYDAFNRLRYILPPACTNALINPGSYVLGNKNSWDNDPLALYAYIYNYNQKGQCTEIKEPGKDWIYNLYDRYDQIIFSQDGNQRLKNYWMYYKYDQFNRLVVQGLATLNQDETQTINLYNTNNAAQTNYVNDIGYDLSPRYCTNIITLRQMYYDNYNFLNTPVFASHSTQLSYDTNTGVFGQKYSNVLSGIDISAKGKLTGEYNNMLDNSVALLKSLYYDENEKLIQSRGNNHIGGYDYDYFAYNFNGAVTAKKHIHTSSVINSVPLTENYVYELDRFSKVLSVKHSINNQPQEIVSSYKYDELGRRIIKSVHNNSYTLNYSYDLQDKLKSIKSSLFNEELFYETSNSATGVGCFNGNISGITYALDNNQKYSFVYDSQNRLINSTWGSDNTFTENIQYNNTNNITTLTRYGKVHDNNYIIQTGIIDQLSFEYSGFHLKTVSDAAEQSKVIAQNDFIDIEDENMPDEYLFDANGNMIADLNKGIAWIRYNNNNLPEKIQFRNGTKNEYTYDALGIKRSAFYNYSKSNTLIPLGNTSEENNAAATYRTEYCNNFIYTQSGDGCLRLSKILIPDGFIETNDLPLANINLWNYNYNIKDHQGNTRVTLNCEKYISNQPKAYTSSAPINYYPYGLEQSTLPQSDGSTLNSGLNPYLYGGKEIDRMNGLNMYDFSARWLDNAIPFFTSFDPLAIERPNENPYSYCGGDPVNRLDPTGLIWYQNTKYPFDYLCDIQPQGYKYVGNEAFIIQHEDDYILEGELLKSDCTRENTVVLKPVNKFTDSQNSSTIINVYNNYVVREDYNYIKKIARIDLMGISIPLIDIPIKGVDVKSGPNASDIVKFDFGDSNPNKSTTTPSVVNNSNSSVSSDGGGYTGGFSSANTSAAGAMIGAGSISFNIPRAQPFSFPKIGNIHPALGLLFVANLFYSGTGTAEQVKEFQRAEAIAKARELANVDVNVSEDINKRYTPGSYTIFFANNKKYHGQGPYYRMIQSAAEKMLNYPGAIPIRYDWTPSISRREGFKDEYRRMQTDATPKILQGYANPINYNKIQSPGYLYILQDGF